MSDLKSKMPNVMENVVIPYVTAVRKGNNLVIKCPYCHQTHRHGLKNGHRTAHCASDDAEDRAKRRNGYILIQEKISTNLDGI